MRRPVLVSIALASTLCACEQTDPAAARGAGGAVGGAAVEQSPQQVEGTVTEEAAQRAATGKHIKKAVLYYDNSAPTAAESQRDAASGLPTGKRQHKPIVVE